MTEFTKNPQFDSGSVSTRSDDRAKFRKRIRKVGVMVVIGVIGLHVLVGVISAVWVVAHYLHKPKAQFTSRSVQMPPEKREHRLPQDRTDSMRRQQITTTRIQSLAPTKLALPALPDVKVDAVMPVDASVSPGDASAIGDPVGAGSGSGTGGFFGDMANPGHNLLEGTLYDLKLRELNKPSEFKDGVTSHPNNELYGKIVGRVVNGGASENSLQSYYKLPKKLYAGQIDIPGMKAAEAPKAFEADIQARYWVIVYRGVVSPPKDGTYRFVGSADDVLVVRFNNRIVLDGSQTPAHFTRWESNDKSSLRGVWGDKTGPPEKQVVYGDWMNLKAGTLYPIQIVIGEMPGGFFYANLHVQEKGVTYQNGPDDQPVLPLFRTVDRKPSGKSVRPVATGGPIFKASAQSGGF